MPIKVATSSPSTLQEDIEDALAWRRVFHKVLIALADKRIQRRRS